MPTYYLDYELGDDANDGSAWGAGTAWKTITGGPTAAIIVPGDVIRIAKSPDPTSLGCNGIWTDAPDTLPTSLNIESSTNAGPIEVTITGHPYSTGDAVYIQNHTTNLTANGTWVVTKTGANTFTLDGSVGVGIGGADGNVTVINWHCVKLATAQVKTITRCEEIWTLANAATVTKDTSQYKEGDASAKIVKASPANSTLYAYFAIPDTNYAGYQTVSFWILNATAITANQWDLCLCSDNAGATVVDTIAIPAIPSISVWTVLTIARNGGGNLGNSIQSVALYSGSSAGTTNGIYLDNIIACTTSGLSLQSLISKNSAAQGGAEGWYGIQSISEDCKLARLDLGNNTNASANITTRGGGYVGTTETVITYKRETIKTAMVGSSTAVQEVQDSGTYGSYIDFQCGYNTSSGLQDGETFFDALNGRGYGLYLTGKSFVSGFDYLNLCRYEAGFYLTGSSFNNNFGNIGNIINTRGTAVEIRGYGNIFDNFRNVNNNVSAGISLISASKNEFLNIGNVNSNNSDGIKCAYHFNRFICSGVIQNNIGYGINFSAGYLNHLINASTDLNSLAGINSPLLINYLHNCFINETTEFGTFSIGFSTFIFSQNHDQTADNHWIFMDGGTINSLATDRVGGTGIMWKSAITSANRSSSYPLDLSIAKIAVAASAVVTVKAYVKKSHATNIGCKLAYRGGQIAGLASDVTVTKADDTNWEELTLTLNQPTAAGVIEIEFWTWYIAANGNGFIEDMTITQAA